MRLDGAWDRQTNGAETSSLMCEGLREGIFTIVFILRTNNRIGSNEGGQTKIDTKEMWCRSSSHQKQTELKDFLEIEKEMFGWEASLVLGGSHVSLGIV